MPLYHIVFLLLLIFTIIEYRSGNTPRKLFLISFAVLSCMLFFRYSQGTDYDSYNWIYSRIDINLFKSWADSSLHSEPGWKFLCWFFKLFHLPFPVFAFAVSVLEMYMFWRFINQYCERKILALFISYHTLYLTFFFSTMRQGVVIAVFLGVLLQLFSEKKYWMYYLISAACATIHSIGLLLFALPILETKMFHTIRRQLFWVVAAWIVGGILATGVFDGVLEKILPQGIMSYFSQRGISVFAIFERLLSYTVVVFAVFISSSNGKQIPQHVQLALRVVSLGMIIYGGFLWLPLVASRMCYIFKVVEIVILTNLLNNKDVFSRLKILFCAVLVSGMYLKNISSYISEGKYFDHVSVLNYPYISIFDTEIALKYKPPFLNSSKSSSGRPASQPNKPVYSYLDLYQ